MSDNKDIKDVDSKDTDSKNAELLKKIKELADNTDLPDDLKKAIIDGAKKELE